MDGGVRETFCSSCCHRCVCAHKDDYLNMIKSLEEMFYKFPKNEREFMHLRDPDCKFYSKILSTPKQPTQRITFSTEEKSYNEIIQRAMLKELDEKIERDMQIL